jgi:transcription-repair coupling factor (superfamily II helicase)
MTAYNGPICVIAKSAAAVEQLQRELNFFCASVDSDSSHVLRRFPDYETLPYEPLSPPKDLLADRLATLSELAQRQRFTLLVNAEVLLNRLRFFNARTDDCKGMSLPGGTANSGECQKTVIKTYRSTAIWSSQTVMRRSRQSGRDAAIRPCAS